MDQDQKKGHARFTMQTMQMDLESIKRGEFSAKPVEVEQKFSKNDIRLTTGDLAPPKNIVSSKQGNLYDVSQPEQNDEPSKKGEDEKTVSQPLSNSQPPMPEPVKDEAPLAPPPPPIWPTPAVPLASTSEKAPIFQAQMKPKQVAMDLKRSLPDHLKDLPEPPLSERVIEEYNKTDDKPARESFGPSLRATTADKEPDITPPPKPQNIITETDAGFPETKGPRLRKALMFGGLFIVILSVGAGIYLILNNSSETTPNNPDDVVVVAPTPTATPSENITPTPTDVSNPDQPQTEKPADLMSYAGEFEVSADSNIGQSLKTFADTAGVAGAFTKILAKKGLSFASLEEFFSSMNVQVPKEIIDNTGNYNVFLYNTSSKRADLGIVAEINNQNAIDIGMQKWENPISRNFSAVPLFLGKKYNRPREEIFKENIYAGVYIRYQNFSEPELSFDYAVIQRTNYLVITTSKNQMYATIDKLIREQ